MESKRQYWEEGRGGRLERGRVGFNLPLNTPEKNDDIYRWPDPLGLLLAFCDRGPHISLVRRLDRAERPWPRTDQPGDRVPMCIASVLVGLTIAACHASGPSSQPASTPSGVVTTLPAEKELSPYDEEVSAIRELRGRVRQLFQERNYEALDRLGAQLLKDRARFRSGSWKLNVYYETLANRVWSDPQSSTALYVKKLKRWSQDQPKSPQALIALADALVNWARETRGGGAAQDTTQEQAKQFIEHLQEAGKHLDSAEALTQKDPELYCARMETIKGSANLAKLKESFETGLAVEPEYYSLYKTMASLLLPRWFGKPGDEVTFAESTALRTRDTEGEGLYARIAMYVSDHESEEIRNQYNFSWKRVQKGFSDIEKRYPDSLVNLNRFARFACIMQDAPIAKRYLDRLGDWEAGRIERTLWGSPQAYSRWQKWAAGRGPNPWGELLHEAAKSSNLRVIKDVIHQKEDLNPRDMLGQTPLFLACKSDHEDAALLLIEAGADVKAKTDMNQTALYQAAGMGLTRVVEKLLSMGVGAGDAETEEGWTPLHFACHSGRRDIVQLLLGRPGVDAAAQTLDGKTPLHLAAARGNVEIGRLLIEKASARANARTREGRTPLHYAANQGNAEFVRLLLNNGADPNAIDSQQRRSLDYAILRDKTDAADLLRPVTKAQPQPRTRPAAKP